ncbi:unnamed protein product [Citrullus colocynthis]|uniref:Uncharacterized protein n=1 Tax=Citrullus colocynthis TaxID=252529 RepID=A0ABP0Y627_9ROSI
MALPDSSPPNSPRDTQSKENPELPKTTNKDESSKTNRMKAASTKFVKTGEFSSLAKHRASYTKQYKLEGHLTGSTPCPEHSIEIPP